MIVSETGRVIRSRLSKQYADSQMLLLNADDVTHVESSCFVRCYTYTALLLFGYTLQVAIVEIMKRVTGK